MENESFKTLIKSNTKWYDVKLGELWEYKDLILLFVKRDFTTRYKQTILGPAWLFLTPLISTIISTFVFGTIAEIPSDGVPYFLFYMCGNAVAWSYFSTCFNSTASTFTNNANLFGKVYFPRLVIPISSVLTGLIDFAIHLVLFIGFWIYFFLQGAAISITWVVCLVPVLLIQTAMLGLGCGIIVSSLTTKYRDLKVLTGFGITLWMYITPIIYSTTSLSPKLRSICMLNPMAPVVEIFRYGFLGSGDISWSYWGISVIVTVIILVLGVILFNKVEKTFMDTV